jgi:protein ImuB
VLRARLVSDAQPELACRYDPVVDARYGPRRRPAASRLSRRAGLPPRPLRLLKRPVALEAVSVVPEGPPLRFRAGGHEHRIVQSWGPERIETGWWRGSHIGRDYYRVETTAGCRYWLFRRLGDGRWFLQGTFE